MQLYKIKQEISEKEVKIKICDFYTLQINEEMAKFFHKYNVIHPTQLEVGNRGDLSLIVQKSALIKKSDTSSNWTTFEKLILNSPKNPKYVGQIRRKHALSFLYKEEVSLDNKLYPKLQNKTVEVINVLHDKRFLYQVKMVQTRSKPTLPNIFIN
jgi:hypothetical protein